MFSLVKATDAAPIVSITDNALASIAHEARQSRDGMETGGILLGTESSSGTVIRHAGGPGPNARRSKNTFLRDLTYAQLIAESGWESDQSQWIGEWHTHPTGGLAPSAVDLNSYMSHLHDPELGFHQFIAVIACFNAAGEVTIATWLVEKNQVRSVQLTRLGEHTLQHRNSAKDVIIGPDIHAKVNKETP